MSWEGADWLERSSREQEEQPGLLLELLRVSQGQSVGDIGAGSGYLTMRLAARVGPTGRVYATDVQPEMLAMIASKIARADGSAPNVVLVEASERDARLPPRTLDLVVMVDAYHELARPKETLAQIATSLRPGGRLALVEYRAEDPAVPIKPEHKMTLAQIRAELDAAAFRIVEVHEQLPRQRVVVARPKSD